MQMVLRRDASRLPALLGLALLAAGTARADDNEPARTKTQASRSAVKPGTDVNNPPTVALGQYVSGRLGEGRTHHVRLDLPEGEYVVLADVERAEKASSNLCFKGMVDGERVFDQNLIDFVTRGAGKVRLAGGSHVVSLQNGCGIVDYRLGVYRASESIPGPYLGRALDPFKTVLPDKAVTVTLDPKSLATREAFFRSRLESGDYELSFRFQAKNPSAIYKVHLHEVDEFGVVERRVDASFGETIKTRLVVADDLDYKFRLQVEMDNPIHGTLTLRKLVEAEAP